MAAAHFKEINENQIYANLGILGQDLGFSAGIWGSFSRNEMTPSSDIDIICYSEKKINSGSEVVTEKLKKNIDKYIRWDVDFIEKDILKFIKTNGTNFHSVFFCNHLVGSNREILLFKKAKHVIQSDLDLSVRELFNLFCSYHSLAYSISQNDDGYWKYSLNGTNKWSRLILAAQIVWSNLIGKSSEEILNFLSHKFSIELNAIKKSYLESLEKRIYNAVVTVNNSQIYHIDLVWVKVFNSFFNEIIPWIQEKSGISSNLFRKFLNKFSLENNILVPEPKCINKSATILLKAFLATSENEIEDIFLKFKNDWWVMSNICINPNTSPIQLRKIVFPDFPINNKIWKTIRLYVAKNKNTDIETLKQILHTPGLRQQDYHAAQLNLNYKINGKILDK